MGWMMKQNKYKKFLFVLIFLFLIIMLINAQKNSLKFKDGQENKEVLNNDILCGDWGVCTTDYNLDSLDNLDYNNIDLKGIQKRECLNNLNKKIIERMSCDASISIKLKKSTGRLEVSGPKKEFGLLPSVKKTDRGIGIFEPPDFEEKEKEVLVSVIRITQDENIKKLEIEILI